LPSRLSNPLPEVILTNKLFPLQTETLPKKAQESVKREMHELKAGKLKSGRSGKKVTSRKQAIAIGLSEARREGAQVPPPKHK
jgi:hypothetical protein